MFALFANCSIQSYENEHDQSLWSTGVLGCALEPIKLAPHPQETHEKSAALQCPIITLTHWQDWQCTLITLLSVFCTLNEFLLSASWDKWALPVILLTL